MDWEKGLVRVWWIKERSFVVVSLVLGFKVVAFLSKDFIFLSCLKGSKTEREREREREVLVLGLQYLDPAQCLLRLRLVSLF